MKVVDMKVKIRSIAQVIAEEKGEEAPLDIVDLILKVIEARINKGSG